MRVADRHQAQLSRIKTKIQGSHDYFRHNYDRYNEFRRFVYESNLTPDDITLLQTLGRPQLEFNTLASRVSRLLGEFSRNEPDIMVTADDENRVNWVVQKVVEQHLRHVLLDIKNHHTRFEVMKDLLTGGFSTLKVYTDYATPMSMEQEIFIERCEPTLCVYDKVTKFSHKGDGMFCAELFPKTKDEFEEEYPEIDIKQMSFTKNFSGFNWTYINDKAPIVLVADYYEKKKSEETIVQVRDGRVITKAEYDKMVDEWDDITVPPSIVGKPRKTIIDRIVRYRMIDNMVIEYAETDYDMLPLVFVDGSSCLVKTPKNGNIRQVCLPYVYHAKGAQRLKNYAGIALANEIENQIQHKMIVAKEALPKEAEFLKAYTDVQQANTYVFNSVYEGNPEQPIPNPIREVQRIPAPPEIIQAFTGADSLMEQILGSFDASLGINNNQLSGAAIREGSMNSNAAAMPYYTGFMQGLQRASELYVSLLPKYKKTPATLPVMDEEGRRTFVKINQDGGIPMDFDTNVLNVVVKAGASFQVQKAQTINMIKEIMGMSQDFARFINEKGLNFVLDNMEGKGLEQLKATVDEWQKEQEQMKQQAMQMQQQEMQNNPAVLKNQVDMQKLQLEAKKNEAQFAVDMEKIAMEREKVHAQVHINETGSSVQLVKAMTERIAKQTDLKIKEMDVSHRHLKEAIEGHHGHEYKQQEHKHREMELASKEALLKSKGNKHGKGDMERSKRGNKR